LGLLLFLWVWVNIYFFRSGQVRLLLGGFAACLLLYAAGLQVIGYDSATFLVYAAALIGFQGSLQLAGGRLVLVAAALLIPGWLGYAHLDTADLIQIMVLSGVALCRNQAGYLQRVAIRRLARVQAEKEKLAADAERERIARVWGLAGGWVLLEWLRFLGPLAFPWPTLGYTLLPTPAIQIADLGGVLLGSVLVVASAAALVSLRWDSPRPYVALTLTWLAVVLYGVTRSPGQGPAGSFLVLRTTIDQFSGEDPDELFQASQRLTRRDRQPGEVPVWSESALRDPALLTQTPPSRANCCA